jgi:MFS family permease
MKQFNKLNNYVGWIVFAIATIVYFLTIEPTVSWWDPGEHISTAYKLQIGHPPGAPTFGMIGRLFSLFAMGNVTKVALMINAMLALSSSFTILFLFWIITRLAQKMITIKDEMTTGQMWSVIAAGFVGALAFTFSDSFWFSAVEANLFGMSLLCTSVVVWAILKWEAEADQKYHYRWILLIAFVIGLSIGVHLLNILTIPALALVFYFKKFKASPRGIIITLLGSVVILGIIMYVLIPGVPQMAGKFELFFVNTIGLPFNSGIIIYSIVLIGLVVWGLIYTQRHKRVVLNTIILSFTLLLIGYSSFMMLVIRSNAGTPINFGAPKDPLSLVSFLNREQYGTWPVLYGNYYTAPVVGYSASNPVYKKDFKKGNYVVIDDQKEAIPVYDPRFTGFFPRMWCTDQDRPGASAFYKDWGGPGVPITATNQEGNPETLMRPTFGENLKFFFNYQVGWMYMRYLMWNFSGRQNNSQGMGDNLKGNWITGIPFIDNNRLGHPQTNLPERMKDNGMAKYFMLPFLLGLLGFYFQMKKDYKNNIVVILLFLMTGIAIVIFLNQKPYEPRERDYSYAASFMAFAIWVGLGVLCLIDWLQKTLKSKEIPAVIIVGVLTTILVPGIMAQQNWKSHDRSGKYAARDIGLDYLVSCDKQGILFTNGDNDTYPLWYNQEVEGVKTDVRNVNLELAGGPWYIQQLYNKNYESDPLPIALAPDQYQQGTNDYVPFNDMGVKGAVELKDVIDFIKSSDPRTFATMDNGRVFKFFPSKQIKITVDTAACFRNGIVPAYLRKKMVDTIYFTIKSNVLYKNDLILLDLIASNNFKRPLYFSAPYSVAKACNIVPYCFQEGWVYKFMPVKADSADYSPELGGVDGPGSYDILMNKCKWGNLNDPKVFVDPESKNNIGRFKQNVLRTAQWMIRKGEIQKVKNLLALNDKYFPYSKFVPEIYDLSFVDLYFQVGQNDKANALLNRMLTCYKADLNYYHSYSAQRRVALQEDIRNAFGVLQQLNMIATKYKEPKVANDIETYLNQKVKEFE